MTPDEVWLFIDAKRPEIRRGALGESQLEAMSEQLENGDYL